ncbi:MAG TPA: O-antigen ligase family protein [Ktedonobacteraceae bacterium]
MVISASFGLGPTMDAYFVAAAFPLLLAQLFSSALEAAVIPVYSRLRMRSDRESASRLLSTLVNCLALGSLPLLLVLIALRQPLIFLSAPGLDPLRFRQALDLAPLFYLALPLNLSIGVLECTLNAEGQFGWPAYAGVLVPLTTALLTLIGGKTWGIVVLCVGGLVGTALQLVIVSVRARKARLHYRLALDLRNPDLRVILSAAWPLLSGALIVQSSPMVDQIFASMLPAGSISAFSYALKFLSIFIGVIFVSVGRAILPYLARQAALNDPDYHAFKATLRLYVWAVGFCVLLLSILLLLLRYPLVELLFQRGAFSAADTRTTVTILSGFVPGLTPMALVFLFSRAFNALGETRIPLVLALVSIGINACFDAIFAHFWQGFGIALATSMTSLATSLLLAGLLYRRIGTLQILRMPPEIQAMVARLKLSRAEKSCLSPLHWLNQCFHTADLRQSLLLAGLTLVALTVGALAVAHNALVTLSIGIGLLLLLCFLRYPFGLLLAWASINVCIGSFLPFFNGNHLDRMLIFPVLCLLPVLPWKEVSRRVVHAFGWFALYLGWVLSGIGLSPLDSGTFLTLWLSMLASIGVGALTLILVTTRKRLFELINVLLITALLVALFGLYGFVTQQRGEVDPETAAFRITSLFTQATTFAFYLSPLIPLAFYCCLYARGVYRLCYIAVLLCLTAALFLTFTRSAYMGLLPGMIIISLCMPVLWRRLLLIGELLLCCGVWLCPAWSEHQFLLARFFNADTATLNGRLYLWQALMRNFQVTRWLGSGLQSSDQLLIYLHVGAAGQGVIGTAPHSLFLGTLYDHGLIGLCLLCMAFLSLGSCLLQGIRKSRGERRMLYAVALASLISILLQSLGSRDLWIQAASASFWMVVTLPLARCWPGNETILSKSLNGDSSPLTESSPAPGFFPLCRLRKCVEGEV